MELNPTCELEMHLADGTLTQHAPVIFQEKDGIKKSVPGHYLLLGNNHVSFEIGTYDKKLLLVIDPSISYSTLLGGNNNDAGEGIAVDSSGSAYVIGITGQITDPTGLNSFPIKNAFDATYQGTIDIFISKFNPDSR